jgi:hypothetical protein
MPWVLNMSLSQVRRTNAPSTEISRFLSTRSDGRGNTPLLFIFKTGIFIKVHSLNSFSIRGRITSSPRKQYSVAPLSTNDEKAGLHTREL